MKEHKTYWTDLRRFREGVEGEDWSEFGPPPMEGDAPQASRRDFLKVLGFSISGAVLAACQKTPVQYAVPYGTKPPEVDPGIPNWYSATCNACPANCTILVKTREGRPIKIEGHPQSPVFGEGTCAYGQGAVLSLYDSGRLRYPVKGGQPTDWKTLDGEVRKTLKRLAEHGKEVVLVTRTVNGPASNAVIEAFKASYPVVRHVVYEADSAYALRKAHQIVGMGNALPAFHFDKAKVIVGIDADFLGTWISPVQFTKDYVASRNVDDHEDISYHIQFEPLMSLTGSNADMRIPVKPGMVGRLVVNLYNEVARKAGVAQLPADKFELAGNTIAHAAEQLWAHRGKGLVVCGVNDVAIQSVVLALNQLLNNYGTTITPSGSYQNLADDEAMKRLLGDLQEGKVGGIILVDVNPVYSLPDGELWAKALSKAELSVAIADRIDETAQHARYVVPLSHFLESWSDYQPVKGYVAVSQPAITPIFDSRSWQDALLAWSGMESDFYSFLKSYWKAKIYPAARVASDFESFWVSAVHDGYVLLQSDGGVEDKVEDEALEASSSLDLVAAARSANAMSSESDGWTVQVYFSVGLRDGRQANNPWLQEMPDPLSKVVWDNYAAVAPSMAERLGVGDEDVIAISVDGHTVELPVVIQPGQAPDTIGVAFGYGRSIPDQPHGQRGGRVANGVGQGVAPFLRYRNGRIGWSGNAKIRKTGKKYPIARTQVHPSMEGRPLALSTTLEAYKNGHFHHHQHELVTLYKEWDYNGHHWGMAIDLSKCTGCSACVVSCTAENNVAVVGKDEVRRRREMHWMRIDRYYSGDPDNPETIHQPVMCQQCDMAPCENVCPVMAIEHSDEGLNQQVYNRCVGTRYCANNCPYKVRRFNWFKYYENEAFADVNVPQNDKVAAMVLNPDVTVRARGVMEKCTFCVQRIQLAKLEAKKEGRALRDGEIKTACQQSCPAGAIVFGDMNDPNSAISKLLKNKRTYRMLDELGIRPSVHYMVKVRNQKHEPTA